MMAVAPHGNWLTYISGGHLQPHEDAQKTLRRSLSLTEGPGLHQIAGPAGALVEYVKSISRQELLEPFH